MVTLWYTVFIVWISVWFASGYHNSRLNLGSICGGDPDAKLKFDLSQLEEFLWDHQELSTIRSTDTNKSVNSSQQYYFSFCRTIGEVNPNFKHKECSNHNVCFVSYNGSVTTVEGFSNPNFHAEQKGHVALSLEGPPCPALPVLNKTLMIDFSCDKTYGLGLPFKRLSQPCHIFFNWPSISLCPESHKKRYLSKCYVFDGEGRRRDLSPLIDPNGYHVKTTHGTDTDYFINICSEVKGLCLNGNSKADGGTAACSKKNQKDVEHLGNIRKASIEYDRSSDAVILTYRDVRNLTKCKDSAYTTVIQLMCPEDIPKYAPIERQPTLKSVTECQMNIEWFTDYACPAERMEGDIRKCKFEKGGDDYYDLSVLQKNGPYKMDNISGDILTGLNETSSYSIVFNVCGGLDRDAYTHCGSSEWKSNSACIVADNTTKSVIGSMKQAKLMYSDRQLSLVYKGVQQDHSMICPEEHVTPSTVINFICDPESDPGTPTFISFQDCNFNIEWRTIHACPPEIKHAVNCTWHNGSHTIDLSPLSRMWDNHFGYRVGMDLNQTKIYYLNVCRPLNPLRSFRKWCHPTAAVCEVTPSGTDVSVISMGVPEESPSLYFDDHLYILYKNGDMCDASKNKTWSSMIKFVCDEDEGDGVPVVSKESSHEECFYKFDWRTRLVCELNLKPVTTTSTTSTQVPILTSVEPLLTTTSSPNPTTPNGTINNEKAAVEFDPDSDENDNIWGAVVVSIIGVLAILLGLFIILNRDARATIRNIIPLGRRPNGSMYYSQVSTNATRTSQTQLLQLRERNELGAHPDHVAIISMGANSSSPYNPTTTDLSDDSPVHVSNYSKLTTASSLNNGNRKASVKKNSGSDLPFSLYDDSDIDLLA